jgi:hypothetical protein
MGHGGQRFIGLGRPCVRLRTDRPIQTLSQTAAVTIPPESGARTLHLRLHRAEASMRARRRAKTRAKLRTTRRGDVDAARWQSPAVSRRRAVLNADLFGPAVQSPAGHAIHANAADARHALGVRARDVK